MDVWRSPRWRESAASWLDERLMEAGIRRTGPVEQPHLRPWATVLSAPTTGGPVWLKACGPGTAFEAGLYELLARVAPERVLRPIAVDAGRGWILLPDGGPALATRLEGDELAGALAAILRRYGELQLALAPEAGAALALGVADMRPAAMPERLDEALQAIGGGDALRPVAAMRETYAGWCKRLGASPLPASIDHNDLHPWNMLVADLGRPDQVRFYDWGDAVLAHPFACMLVPLSIARERFGLDSPAFRQVRDAYLEPFAGLAPHAELAVTLKLACRVAKVARALTWHRAVSAADPGEIEPHFAGAPRDSLLALLDDSYLGGA